MKRLIISISFIICHLSFSSVAAQSGYGTGNGFNPENPAIPGANGLYLDKGLVILDGLRGDSYDEVDEAIYSLWNKYCDEHDYSEYSSERNEENMLRVFSSVKTVIVCADFSSELTGGTVSISSDIGRYFREMTTLDLSRTTGWTVDYGVSDDEYLENLEVLILPDCVEEVVPMAELHRLTDIYCYAELPPTVRQYSEWYVRPLFAEDTEVTVHVPAGSVALYKAHDDWGKYSIVDIESNIGRIEVKMPAGVDVAQYRNMWLTLTDETTQLVTRYVVTDRQGYFFPGINGSEGITYSAALVNRLGTVVCRQTGIKPVAGTTQVELKDPKPVTIITPNIRMPDGQDVTESVTLTWYDTQGERITSSASLAGVVAGDVIQCDIKLSKDLLTQYAPPERKTVTVPDYVGATYKFNLLTLKRYTVHGVVGFLRDADTKLPLHEISVTAIQDMGEGVTNTYNSLSYSDGRFIVQCFEGPLTISLSSKEYLRRDLQFDIWSSTPEQYLVGDYFLKRAEGKTISFDMKEIRAGVGQQAEPFYYSPEQGYGDLMVTVYNESKGGERLPNVSVQIPQVLILSGADDSDELRLDFSSVSGFFDPFSLPVTVSGSLTTVPLTLVHKGGYQSTFRSTQNDSVVGIVYDSEGHYVRHDLHKKAKLTVKGLTEGDYTLVTMAYDPVVSRLTTLQALGEMGLEADRDYLQRDFHVSPGILTVIEQDEVPVINIDAMKIVHPSSTFSVSEQQVTLGDYVAVHARIKVKNEIAQSYNYGNFRLLFDLPKNARYLSGSLMVDGALEDMDYDEESRLLINSSALEEGKTVDVRFCLVVKDQGVQTVSALVGYTKYDWTNGDEDYYSPAGAATFEGIPMSYHIQTETTGDFIATGNGPTDAVISAYEDGILLGQTTITGKAWGIKAPLPSGYNLSLHNIWLECKTKEGNVFTTPATTVMVNRDMNAVKRVTMIYPNAFSQKTEICTWEFLEPDTRVESYDYYPSSTAFTFLTEFMRNDTTEIDNVKLRVKFENGSAQYYPAIFDEERGCWVTAIDITGDPPVGVAVSYDRKKSDKHIDRQQLDDFWKDMEAYVARQNQLAAILSDVNDDNIDQKMAEADAILGVTSDDDGQDAEYREWAERLATMTEEEIGAELQSLNDDVDAHMAEMDAYMKDVESLIDIKGTYTLDDGTVFSVTDCSAYNEATITQQGFQAMTTTDGSEVYMLTEETHVAVVDFKNNYTIDVVCAESLLQGSPNRASGSTEAMARKCIDYLQNVVLAGIQEAYDKAFNKITEVTEYLFNHYKYLKYKVTYYEGVIRNPGTSMADRVLARAKLAGIKVGMRLTQKGLDSIRFVSNALAKAAIIPNYIILVAKYCKLASDYWACEKAVPNPCPKMEGAAQNIRSMINIGMEKLLGYCLIDIAANFTCDVATLGGIFTAPETFGASLLVSVGSVLFKTAAQWAFDWAVGDMHMNDIVLIRACIRNLECDEEPEDEDEGTPEEPYTPNKKPLHDPSGFVCEAVESNRLEGVTATCLYKKQVEDMYGDKHEEVTVWDAENYGQINPQLTDRQGMYSWMVPAGQWQVLYEKDGYETQRSAWLPVPPPQLDVNVGMVRRAQPALSEGHAYERAIDVTFSLYMKGNYITPQTLTFWQDGQQLQGELKATNGETAFGHSVASVDTEDSNVPQYATTFRFVPKKQLAVGSKVTVRALGLCRTYADVPMGEDQELRLTVGREVTSIGSDGNIVVPYGGTHQLVISALSAQAAAHRNVTITSLSPDIAQLETGRVTLDAEGKAYITVIGRLPGTTYLSFAVEDSQVKGMDTVRVVSSVDFVEAPKASIISGMYVSEGTRVELTAQEGCTIWYTLDGSCPCDEAKRQRYTGPITITSDMKLRAMATDAQGRESEVVTFTWFISTGIAAPLPPAPKPSSVIYDLQGRKVDKPDNGIYIIEGRKRVRP